MAAGQGEVASSDVPRAFTGSRGLVPHAKPRAGDGVVNRLEREVGGEPERKPTREQKAVPGVEQHRLWHAFDDQPALAGEHGVALDSLMFRKVDGHVAQHRKTAGDVNLRLHQGKNLGERVHTLTSSQTWLQGRSFGVLSRQDDWSQSYGLSV